MSIEEEINVNEAENASISVTTSEFDGLTKSARRRLKRKLVSQSTLNASNSPETDDNEIANELSSASTEVCIQLNYIKCLFTNLFMYAFIQRLNPNSYPYPTAL